MKIYNYSVRVLNGKKNPADETAEGRVPLKHGEQYCLLLRNFSDQDSLAQIKIDGKMVACVKVPAKEKIQVDAPFDSDQKFTFYKKTSEEAKAIGLDEEVSREDLGSIEVKFVAVSSSFKWKETRIFDRVYYVPVYPNYWYPWGPYTTWGWSTGGLVPSTYTVTATPTITTNLTYSVNHTGVSSSGITINSSGGTSGVTYANATPTSTVTNYCSTGLSSGGTGLSGMAEHIPTETENLKVEFEKEIDPETMTTVYLQLVCKDDTYRPIPSKMVGYSNKKPAPID